MNDEFERNEEEEGMVDETSGDDVVHGDDLVDADQAEAEEAFAAAEEEAVFDDVDAGADYEDDAEAALARQHEALAEADDANYRARAAWSLVHKELMLMLLANCFFFAGVLVAWTRLVPWMEGPNPQQAANLTGLDHIRGSIIFALAIYGFWVWVVNIRFRQLIIWPYLINAILALWVGIGALIDPLTGYGSVRWEMATEHLKTVDHNFLDKIFTPLSVIPPGFYLLTFGGALVLIVLIKGILGGASQSRAAKTEQRASGGRAGRRR